MKRLLVLAGLLLLLPVYASAQSEHPKAEVYAGYSYVRVDDDNGGIDLHGWNVSVTGNFTRHFGLVADFGGGYGSATVGPGVKPDLEYYSFLTGPRLYLRRERVSPFVHALFGVVRRNDVKLSGVTLVPSDSAFAVALGGGVDIKVADRVAFRLFQADYFLTRFISETQNNLRVSTGLVLR